jgi:hypothetical protein
VVKKTSSSLPKNLIDLTNKQAISENKKHTQKKKKKKKGIKGRVLQLK